MSEASIRRCTSGLHGALIYVVLMLFFGLSVWDAMKVTLAVALIDIAIDCLTAGWIAVAVFNRGKRLARQP